MATSIEFAASSPSCLWLKKKRGRKNEKDEDEVNGTKGKIQFTRNRVTALETINLSFASFLSSALPFHTAAILCYGIFVLAFQRINRDRDTS